MENIPDPPQGSPTDFACEEIGVLLMAICAELEHEQRIEFLIRHLVDTVAEATKNTVQVIKLYPEDRRARSSLLEGLFNSIKLAIEDGVAVGADEADVALEAQVFVAENKLPITPVRMH